MFASPQLGAIGCARRGSVLASCLSFSARQASWLPRQRSMPVVALAASRRGLLTATAAPRLLSADAPPAAAPTPSPSQDKIIYVGPANSNIQFIKRLAAGTVFCFGVAYPIAAVVLNVGTATYGLGTRLLLSGIGSLFSIGLTTVLHKFTKGYIISIAVNPAHPHIWRAQVFTVLGTVKEVDIDTRTVQPSKSKYFQFTCAAGVDYFVLFALFEDKRLWLRLGLPMSGDDVLAAREAGVPIDEKKILEDEAKRGAQVFK